MISLKAVAQDCLGVSGTISVDRDLYGYIFRDGDGRRFGQLSTFTTFPPDTETLPDELPDTLPDTILRTAQPTTRSLRQHLERIQGKSINLSIFMVGYDNFSGSNTLDDLTKVQFAIQMARDIYAQAGLGIRKIYWDRISVAQAGTFTNIADKPEAKLLTDAFQGENDGIDAFFVPTIAPPAGGWCNNEGPCDKESTNEMTGVVISLARRRRREGIILAHELAHYLGLPGGTSKFNLMGVASTGSSVDDTDDVSTGITSSQAADMRDHCFVLPAC